MILSTQNALLAVLITALAFDIIFIPVIIYKVIKLKKLKKGIEIHKDSHLDSNTISLSPISLILASTLISIIVALILVLVVEVYVVIMLDSAIEKTKKEYNKILEEE